MKEKILSVVQGLIKTSDIEEFLSLLKEKTVYIKKQPIDFVIASKNDITTILKTWLLGGNIEIKEEKSECRARTRPCL